MSVSWQQEEGASARWPKGLGCPDCGTEMQKKAWLMIDVGDEGQGGIDVYQCPKCKNIEIE